MSYRIKSSHNPLSKKEVIRSGYMFFSLGYGTCGHDHLSCSVYLSGIPERQLHLPVLRTLYRKKNHRHSLPKVRQAGLTCGAAHTCRPFMYLLTGKMRESLVSFGHSMGIVFLFDSVSFIISSRDYFVTQLNSHFFAFFRASSV